MSLLVHAGEGLDWTGRGRVAGVSNERLTTNCSPFWGHIASLVPQPASALVTLGKQFS